MGAKRILPPPPYRRRNGVEIWALEILREVPGVLGAVLWQDLRHLRSWDDARPYKSGKVVIPDRRALVFHPERARWAEELRRDAVLEAPALVEALQTLRGFTNPALPIDEGTVASACDAVAQWASDNGHCDTAIHFAEAAGLIDRSSARRARIAGKLSREAGDFPRAEVWFQRGIGLAQKRGDWAEYTRAHLGLGIMYMRTGQESRAQKHFNSGSSVAMREGHEWLAAEAQHDLFHFMTVRGRYVDGEIHARRALSWYPKHNKRFPYFIADVAFLFVCKKHYTAAAQLLREFAHKIKPPNSVLGLSLLVRALASAGKRGEFLRRRDGLLRLLEKHKEYEAAARWNLAHAERAAGMWDAATANARLAVELAHQRKDAETEDLARRLLEEIEAGTPTAAEIHRTDPDFRIFVDDLLRRIAAWSPTRRGRPPGESKNDWAA